MGEWLSLIHISRTVKEHKDELTKEEYKAIDDVLSIEGLGEAYNPTVSDPIKWRAKTSFNAASDEWRAWVKTWFKMALEYPCLLYTSRCV